MMPAVLAMLGCCVLALVYSEIAGLWGVVLTDLVEFGIAMVGAIVLAGVAMVRVGGPSGLRSRAERARRPPE